MQSSSLSEVVDLLQASLLMSSVFTRRSVYRDHDFMCSLSDFLFVVV